jgi:hypothetical protein
MLPPGAIEIGSQIRTNDWKGYSGLDRLGYRHQIVRSSAEVGENLLPLPNRVASLLKRWLLCMHQGAVSVAHPIITWTSTPSASTAAHPDRAASCSCD